MCASSERPPSQARDCQIRELVGRPTAMFRTCLRRALVSSFMALARFKNGEGLVSGPNCIRGSGSTGYPSPTRPSIAFISTSTRPTWSAWQRWAPGSPSPKATATAGRSWPTPRAANTALSYARSCQNVACTAWWWTAPTPKTVKNRIHWDVGTADVSLLVDAGAAVLRPAGDDTAWYVMADPEGNEFCVFIDP